MKILVLLTCYNRKEKTIRCINSLISDKTIDWMFLVVDDNSSDGTVEALKHYPNIELICGDGKLYYSGGMRLAIHKVKSEEKKDYDFVLLVNDDVCFHEHSIERLIKYLDGEPAIMVGATEDHGVLTYGGVVRTSKIRPSYKTVISDEKKVLCDTFNANCVLIPYHIFKKLDNIDKIYRHAMGDYDYGLEARKKGITIYVSNFFVGECLLNSPANTWHNKNLSRRQRIKLKENPKGLPFKEWFHYLNKNHGLFTALLYSITPYIKILLNK